MVLLNERYRINDVSRALNCDKKNSCPNFTYRIKAKQINVSLQLSVIINLENWIPLDKKVRGMGQKHEPVLLITFL